MGYIYSLRGLLVEKAPASIVIECGGIGYRLMVPLSTFDYLPATGQSVKLFTAHIIRDDDHLLFGFATYKEREFFDTLLTISGIGPKSALNILSGLPLGDLITAIAEGDVKRISSISGIGKKTAERIIVELKDKVDPLEAIALKGRSAGASTGLPGALRDTILSLVALGNKTEDAKVMAQTAYEAKPDASVQELIRLALRK
ncbi:MAG: Holliday junction branch migration protein RuvA [Kiritimatiellia bacterium]